MIKILIADDHTMFADGLDSILAGESDMQVLGKVQTGQGVFEFTQYQEIDLLLLDFNLVDMTGVEVAKRLSKEKPLIKILVISMFKQDSFITEIIEQGALGYILKNTDKEELISAIRTVATGKSFFSKEVTESIMQGLLKNQDPNHKRKNRIPKLTRREREVLDLIAQELTTQEIANKLFINLKTVESHRSSLLAKFDARNVAGLVRNAMQLGALKW